MAAPHADTHWKDKAGAAALPGFPTANWLIGGTLVHAGYPGASDPSLGLSIRDAVLEAGVSHIVCLQPYEELPSLPPYLGTLPPGELRHAQPLGVSTRNPDADATTHVPISWQHFPIQDYGIVADDEQLRGLLEESLARIAAGGVLLVHCMGGHGRSGIVCACLVGALLDLSADAAIELVQHAHDLRADVFARGHKSPETAEQHEQVVRLLGGSPRGGGKGHFCRASSRIAGGLNNVSFRLAGAVSGGGSVLKLYGTGEGNAKLTNRERERRLMDHLVAVVPDGALCKRLLYALPVRVGL